MALVVLLAVLLAGAAAGFGYLAWQRQQAADAVRAVEREPLPAVERAYDAPADEPAENPIDFEALRRESPDVYAWLYVPNTNVNLPVLQRPGDDFFYLDHDRYGEPAVEGAVFSQMANATDFSDPVTVLYGHNIVNDAMFATLHAYEDPAFFADNPELYVYLPDRILAYEVVAAYEYDDRHILNSFDFSDPAVRTGYFAVGARARRPEGERARRRAARCRRPHRAAQHLPLGPDQRPGALYRYGRARGREACCVSCAPAFAIGGASFVEGVERHVSML